MNYKNAISEFNALLLNDELVNKSAEHYGVTADKIVSALQCRIYTKANRKGETTKVWLDFLDTDTNLHFTNTLTN